ncbi:MAG: hypothetical protein RLZZ618_3123 [Pseudomonadota bacterium]|jgi:peptidyl-prolyl cis-trans isomerase C
MKMLSASAPAGAPVFARVSVIAAVAAGLLSPLAVLAQAKPAKAKEVSETLTTVNGRPVPRARVESLLQQAMRGGQQTRSTELETQVRDEVVLREMFAQEAVRRGLATSPGYMSQIELARQSILIRELFNDEQKRNPVTDEAIKAEYDKFRAQAGGQEFRARHILVKKEEQAKSLIAQIKGGAKFEELAKKHSDDPGSGQNGGDLDWADPGSYVPEFAAALVKLKKGEMTSEPVQSKFGYHIIKLEDTRSAQPPSLEDVKPQIKQKLDQDKMVKFREEIKNKSKTSYKFATAE